MTREKSKTTAGRDYYLMPCQEIKSQIAFSKLPPKTRIDSKTIVLLEKLSSVDWTNQQSIELLKTL